jgi:hypothetical protein
LSPAKQCLVELLLLLLLLVMRSQVAQGCSMQAALLHGCCWTAWDMPAQ